MKVRMELIGIPQQFSRVTSDSGRPWSKMPNFNLPYEVNRGFYRDVNQAFAEYWRIR